MRDRLGAPVRDDDRASASSARVTTEARGTAQRRPPVDLLDLPSRIPAVDPAQAGHAAAVAGVTGPVHGEVQTTPPGLDLLRRAALQAPLEASVVPGHDPDDHVMRVILGKTIFLGVRG